MKNAAGTEGQGHGERREADVLFPSEGNFSTVVPLSQSGGKSAGTAPGGLEEEEATLVPRRGRRRRGTRPAPASLARQGFEHSLAFLAAAVVLSLAAGAVA